MKLIAFLMLAAYPLLSLAEGRDMEKFTHIAGVELSDYLKFDEIARRFGKAEIVRTGDAADYFGKVCYLTKQRDAVLEFNESELYRGYEIRVPNGTERQCLRVESLDSKKSK